MLDDIYKAKLLLSAIANQHMDAAIVIRIQHTRALHILSSLCLLLSYGKPLMCLLKHQLSPVGLHRFCDQDETGLRDQGARLNPNIISNDSQGFAVYTKPDDAAPHAKTDAIMRAHARASDAASTAGIKRKQAAHPSKQSGVHASHAFMKIPGWNDQQKRKPDGMHTPVGEVKAVTVMLGGGTADKYSRDQLKLLADWEMKHNNRWEQLLAPYRAGNECCLESLVFPHLYNAKCL